jgi:uncharacterized membrane protein/glutaredoxin
MEKLLIKFLKRCNVNVDNSDFISQINSHKNSKSLLSIYDAFIHFDIECFIGRVSDVQYLPNNFMTFINDELVLVKKTKEFFLVEKENEKLKLHTEEFLNGWNSIVLAVEDKTYTSIKLSNNMIGLLLIISGFYYFYDYLGLFISSLLGLYFSFELIRKEVGLSSKVSNTLCGININFDCNEVIKSNSHFLNKFFNLPILCFGYFLWSIFQLFISRFSNNMEIYELKYILSFVTIPVIIYSIYLQFFVIKKICTLCLFIATIVLFESILSVYIFSTSFIFDFKISHLLNSFFIILILKFGGDYLSFKDILKGKFDQLNYKYTRFKSSFDLFSYSLNESNMTINTTNVPAFVLGERRTKLTVTFVTNLFCNYCKDIPKLIRHIQEGGFDVTINLLLFVDVHKADDLSIRAHNILLRIYSSNAPEFLKALSDWYLINNKQKWFKKYGKASDDVSLEFYENQKKWIDDNDVNFTPSIFINEKSFPMRYEKEDLLLFLDDLLEQV